MQMMCGRVAYELKLVQIDKFNIPSKISTNVELLNKNEMA